MLWKGAWVGFLCRQRFVAEPFSSLKNRFRGYFPYKLWPLKTGNTSGYAGAHLSAGAVKPLCVVFRSELPFLKCYADYS